MEELLPHLAHFSAIIVGPGPGSPANPQDIGLVKDLWHIKDEYLLPVLGVCLGLQSLAIEFGARLHRLHVVRHGQVSTIHHVGTDLFEGVGSVEGVRYHSLHVELPEFGELEELAWTDDGQDNGRVTMAVKHKTRPFWAVQYHPESVCTEGGGAEIVRNFWYMAQRWTAEKQKVSSPWNAATRRIFGHPWPNRHPHPPPTQPQPSLTVSTVVVDASALSVTTICELLGALDEHSPFVLLDSAAKPGRFSVIGSLLPDTLQISYSIPDTFLTLKRGESTTREDLGNTNVWSWLAAFIRPHRAKGSPEIPFWGGLVGLLSYELGVNSLRIPRRSNGGPTRNRHPDVNLVFVERSVVLDTHTNKAYVQSLLPNDGEWISRTVMQLMQPSPKPLDRSKKNPSTVVKLPDRNQYISRINQAKEHLFAGDSYEICLTAPTRISIPNCSASTPSSWERYKMLRRSNPAPHSAYLRLHPSTLLSSSPERFLSFSRPPNSICQLRPIKGTVRKAPGIDRAVAEELLAGSTKEVAENLMIVDLIRHDLHGVVGEDVKVKKFCVVEEYETVWQLVSVIEGKAAEESLDEDSEIGWEVLRRSLPPGKPSGGHLFRLYDLVNRQHDWGSQEAQR